MDEHVSDANNRSVTLTPMSVSGSQRNETQPRRYTNADGDAQALQREPRPRGVLRGINPNNVIRPISPENTIEPVDDDENAHKALLQHSYTTRISTKGRSAATFDQYDMKYHPLDEHTRPARAAKRRSGSRSVSLLNQQDDEEVTEEDSLPSSARDTDSAESELEENDVDGSDPHVDQSPARQPDPKATRHSSRAAAQQHHDYNSKHHPQDYGIPGHQHKASKKDRRMYESRISLPPSSKKRKRVAETGESSATSRKPRKSLRVLDNNRSPRKTSSKKKKGKGGKTKTDSSTDVADELADEALRKIGAAHTANGAHSVVYSVQNVVAFQDEEVESIDSTEDPKDDLERIGRDIDSDLLASMLADSFSSSHTMVADPEAVVVDSEPSVSVENDHPSEFEEEFRVTDLQTQQLVDSIEATVVQSEFSLDELLAFGGERSAFNSGQDSMLHEPVGKDGLLPTNPSLAIPEGTEKSADHYSREPSRMDRPSDAHAA